MITASKFSEIEICPNLHDRYVKAGMKNHARNCYCDCSYCTTAKLRLEFPEK